MAAYGESTEMNSAPMSTYTSTSSYDILYTASDYVSHHSNLTGFPEQYDVTKARCKIVNRTAPLQNEGVYHLPTRLQTLLAEIIIGNLGCFLLLLWIWCNRRFKCRVNQLIFHVTIADLYVADVTMLSQFIWEISTREWIAGDFVCRLLKFLQVLGMLSSTNMVMMLAFDRHQAILRPLKQPIRVWFMAIVAWVTAVLTALPQLYVFSESCVEFVGSSTTVRTIVCTSIWSTLPRSHVQAYIIFACAITFIIPVTFLLICYSRIFFKIWRKERENRSSNTSAPTMPGEIRSHATNRASLRKAKTKTLIMTIVIVIVYIICTFPYIYVEMVRFFGNAQKLLPPVLYSIAGVALATNSVTNPYIFLLFNAQWQRCVGRKPKPDRDAHGSMRSEMLSNSVNMRFSDPDSIHAHALQKGGERNSPTSKKETLELSEIQPLKQESGQHKTQLDDHLYKLSKL